MKSIGPMGDAWNGSSPGEILEESEVSAQIQGLFEKRIGWHGLNLREIAILAALLEDLVRGQAVAGLKDAYRLYNLPVENSSASEIGKVQKAFEAYLAYHILSENITKASR